MDCLDKEEEQLKKARAFGSRRGYICNIFRGRTRGGSTSQSPAPPGAPATQAQISARGGHTIQGLVLEAIPGVGDALSPTPGVGSPSRSLPLLAAREQAAPSSVPELGRPGGSVRTANQRPSRSPTR